MNAKTLTRPTATTRPLPSSGRAIGLLKKPAAAEPPDMAAQLEGLIATVVRKLTPAKPGPGVKVYSREVYRADAIALLIAASQHMGLETDEDREIMDRLLAAQKACSN